MNKLQCNKLEATLLESTDDGADESTLDTVGLRRRTSKVSTQNDDVYGADDIRTLTMM